MVNVLPGETLDENTLHLEETVNTTSTSSQQTTTQTTTNSQTTSQTLSQTSTSTASQSIGASAQVEMSGGFGPMQVKTNIGAQVQTSKSSSQSLARTTAVQTVASAVKAVSQTVMQSQTTRTTVKDTDRQEHKQENQTNEPIVGLYRWLSVVHRVQLVTYPNRLVLEFEIPEPGAWLRWALTNQPDMAWSNPDPGSFTTDGQDLKSDNSNIITPSWINQANVATLASRWRIQGLTQPPSNRIIVGQSYTLPQASTPNSPQVSDNSIAIPDGYQANTWSATLETIGGGDNSKQSTIWVGVGNTGIPNNIATKTSGTSTSDQAIGGTFAGNINSGTVPVSINGFYTAGGVVNIIVTCTQQVDQYGNSIVFQEWQESTFDQVCAAYNTLLSNYNQERVQRAQTQAGPIIVGPPELNLARTVAELKKLVIQDLLGQTFTPPELWAAVPQPAPDPNPGPTLDPQTTRASSPIVQFFEQVFEWENIVYICYPYYWGGVGSWIENSTYVSSSPSDPVFDQFLNAGSTRVVVPVRPGFEKLVNWYLYTQQVWGGQNPPGPNDPTYLSIADEIESIQVGADDGTPVDPWWEVTLPTTFLWAGTLVTTLPVNQNPTIGPPPAPGGGGA